MKKKKQLIPEQILEKNINELTFALDMFKREYISIQLLCFWSLCIGDELLISQTETILNKVEKIIYELDYIALNHSETGITTLTEESADFYKMFPDISARLEREVNKLINKEARKKYRQGMKLMNSEEFSSQNNHNINKIFSAGISHFKEIWKSESAPAGLGE